MSGLQDEVCTSSATHAWKYVQEVGLEGILGGGLTSELAMTSAYSCCKTVQCSFRKSTHMQIKTKVCKVDLPTLTTCSYHYSFCTDVSSYMNYLNGNL